MRAVLQRVHGATLSVNDTVVSQIGTGAVVMVGVVQTDTRACAEKLAYRIATTRIFKDDRDKLNLSLCDVGGSVLLVSNFTLCASKRSGTRPDFSLSAGKDEANTLYLAVADVLRQQYHLDVQCGVFGEHMHIDTTLDGPITLFLDVE